MRRAAISIPSNIAEGQARHTTGEFVQFISRRGLDSRAWDTGHIEHRTWFCWREEYERRLQIARWYSSHVKWLTPEVERR